MSIKTGIYCFTNSVNGKQYIGQAINIFDRIHQHKYRYQNINDTGYKSSFHSALRKYGWDSFVWKIVEECSPEELDEKESFWIDEYQTIAPNGYNILRGGQGFKYDPRRFCPKCGKTKSIQAKLCIKCTNKNKEGQALIKKEDIDMSLIFKILDTSYEAVAKELGYTSGNALKKRVIAAGFPGNKSKLFEYYQEKTGEPHPKIKEKQELKIKKEQTRKQQAPKRVGQYSLDGILIVEYNSTKEAQRAGFSSGHISECCNGKRKKYKNYIWKYI